jgi:hypothetical protein
MYCHHLHGRKVNQESNQQDGSIAIFLSAFWLILWTWRWRHYVLSKRWWIYSGLRGIMSLHSRHCEIVVPDTLILLYVDCTKFGFDETDTAACIRVGWTCSKYLVWKASCTESVWNVIATRKDLQNVMYPSHFFRNWSGMIETSILETARADTRAARLEEWIPRSVGHEGHESVFTWGDVCLAQAKVAGLHQYFYLHIHSPIRLHGVVLN